MERNIEKLENLLKETRIADSKTLEVDQEFKNTLREKLYTHYLNNESKGGLLMKILKSLSFNPKVALLGVALVAVIAGVVLVTTSRKGSEEKEVLLAANLAVADGEVEIKKTSEDRWMNAALGDTLNEGDSIRTAAESRAVLELDNGDAVRLDASSEVKLESMDPGAVVMEQVSGETYCRVAKSEENTFTVKGDGVEAQALGTAYTFKQNKEEKQVVVSVYDSKVKVKTSSETLDVDELSKAVVNTSENKVEVSEMNEEEYKSEFAQWNKGKDKEGGFTCHEENGPVVTITSPADQAEVGSDAASIVVTGTVTDSESVLKKIIVNGTIYMSKDENGKGFDPSDGTFDVDVALNEGANEIKVKAYDIYWNASEEVTIIVTRKAAPEPTQSFYVSSATSPASGKILVKWVMSGYSAPNGFKVVASTDRVPVYPGDKFTYESNGSKREAYITGLSAGTYKVRVCIYNGSGACTMYTTNYKTVTVSGDVSGETSGVKSILLSGSGANINWSVVGYSANGFKVAWSKNSGPTYPTRPGDEYHYLSDPNARTDTITAFDGAGNYFVRVCEYLGGKCEVYSNEISVSL